MDLTNLIQELYHTKPIIIKTNLGLSNDIYKAVINDKKYEVKTLAGIIDPGEEVEVVMIEDNKIYVKQPDIEF